ncbi:MAG: AbrB/MazE/SpoVT family DNA-binding domain-containing protein [Actinobacteria bacterium]|nr:AbrB/MazE/SpoVT family DNA-binding domain-containing protein [Actinomycetota bacterium]
MGTYPLRIGDRGRIVLPAALRRESGLREGEDVIAIVEAGGRVILESRDRLMEDLRTACAQMEAGSGLDELAAWRAEIEADRLEELDRTVVASPESVARGRALLDELGL